MQQGGLTPTAPCNKGGQTPVLRNLVRGCLLDPSLAVEAIVAIAAFAVTFAALRSRSAAGWSRARSMSGRYSRLGS